MSANNEYPRVLLVLDSYRVVQTDKEYVMVEEFSGVDAMGSKRWTHLVFCAGDRYSKFVAEQIATMTKAKLR